MANKLFSDDELTHYGVLGMRWGKRGGRSSSGSSGSSSGSGNRRMTNKELTNRVKRLRLEKEYRDLTAIPKKKSKVESIVKGVGTVATLSTGAVTIYKNYNELQKIVGGGKS